MIIQMFLLFICFEFFIISLFFPFHINYKYIGLFYFFFLGGALSSVFMILLSNSLFLKE